MRRPRATYRVQLHAGFTFDDAAAAIPYLARLGISDLYCSPILQAAPGSTHGYDVTDHSRISDELGGATGFDRLSRAAASHDLALVVDIVPNHMALAGAANRWWWDVLEDGQASPFATHFDIDWTTAATTEPSVLMPILGEGYGKVVEAGELELEREGGSFTVRYHEHELPLSPRSLDSIVRAASATAKSDALGALADRLEALPLASVSDPAAARRRHDGKVALRHELRELAADDPAVADALDAELRAVATDADSLDELLLRQNYRLAHWRVANDELDYRRFFDVTTLVGLRVEDDDVFEDTHRLVLELVDRGDVTGLRVDHVDGLRDPGAYLARLRSRAPSAWLVVEKIVADDEQLPESWPVAGTTGYDFAHRVGDLFIDPAGLATLVDHHATWTGDSRSFAEVARDAQLHVLRNELAAEVERVTELAMAVCRARRRHRDHTRRDVRDAICELAAAMPVYRTYEGTSDVVELTVHRVRTRRADIDEELLDLFARVLRRTEPGADADELAARFEQLSAPAMAKGVEDTALYRWAPLLAANDVGSDPSRAGAGVAPFHAHNARIARDWPATMLALSTHDSKRSADTRARNAVLTELAPAWTQQADAWRARNRKHHPEGWDDPVLELLLYQTLVSAWPITIDRLEPMVEKSANEAKLRTSWADPDEGYLEQLRSFVRAVVADRGFVADVERFLAAHDLVARGRTMSLAQVALELTAPGVPDTYQGDERWQLRVVDPDNREPVDLASAAGLLEEIADAEPEAVLARADEGAPKLWLVHRLLQHRRRAAHLYETPHYEPLPIADLFVAFARDGLAVVVPRRTDWHQLSPNTSVALPPGPWTNVLTDDGTHENRVELRALLARFPVAILERVER